MSFKSIERPPQLVLGALVIGFYCSTAFILGKQLETNSAIEWRMLTWVMIIGFGILAAVPGGAVLHLCLRRNADKAPKSTSISGIASQKNLRLDSKALKRGGFRLAAKHKAISIACMIMPQIAVFFIMFPGMYGYDAGSHILQFINETVPITTRWSAAYTLYLGAFVSIGQRLGAVQACFAAAMFLQALISIAILYRCLKFIATETGSKVAWAITLAFFSLFPFGLILRVSSAQDVLFGAFFLAALIELIKLGKKLAAGESTTTKEALPYVVFSILYLLMRNNGLYALAIGLVLSIPLVIRKRGWKIFGVIALPAVLFLIINGPIFSAVGISPSGHNIREMLSIPAQQISRSLETNRNDFTGDDIAAIQLIFNGEESAYAPDDASWYWAESEISDTAKLKLDENYIKQNPVRCLQLWANIGLKAPKAYLEAFAMNSLGFWYPSKLYPDSRMYHPYIEYDTTPLSRWDSRYIDIPRASLFPEADKAISAYVYGGEWSESPLSITLKSGFYFMLFVICLVSCKYAKRCDLYPMFYLVGGFIITLFLAPVCLFRYIYPLVLAMPLLFLVFFKSKRRHASKTGAFPNK